MIKLLINEVRKLKRSDIVLIFLLVWLFIDILAAFQLYSGQDVAHYIFTDFTNIIIWDSFSMILPAMLLIFNNYLFNLEHLSDTLKNNLTIPVSLTSLYMSKIIILGVINLIFATLNALFSFMMFSLLPHAVESGLSILFAMVQMIGMSFGVYVAILPIIFLFIQQTDSYLNVVLGFVYGFVGIFVAGQNLQDFYPITTFLKIINYDNGSLSYHGNLSYLTIIIWLIITLLIGLIQKHRLQAIDVS